MDFGFDFVPQPDEVFSGVAGGYDFEGLVDGWVDDTGAVFAADTFVEATDTGRFDMVVEGDGALDGLEVTGCRRCLSLLLLCSDFQLFNRVDSRHHDVNTFSQDALNSTELQENSPISGGNEDDSRSCRADQNEENGSDTHRDVEAHRCLWQQNGCDCQKNTKNGKGEHWTNSP